MQLHTKPAIGALTSIALTVAIISIFKRKYLNVDRPNGVGIFCWMNVRMARAGLVPVGFLCLYSILLSGCIHGSAQSGVPADRNADGDVVAEDSGEVIELVNPPAFIDGPQYNTGLNAKYLGLDNDEVTYEELVVDEITTPDDPEIVHAYPLPLYGWVEWACIMPDAIRMKAKLDSGAKTSSISAHDIVQFERDGARWVRFVIDNPETGQAYEMERPLSRRVRIVRHEDKPQRRPVVELEVKVGEVHQKVEFSLIDRENFIYPILIGRNFMRGHILLDTDNTFLAPRPCE